MVNELQFSLSINSTQALRYYRGEVRFVRVIASNGQRIQFPAEHIRPFIEEKGVHGRFVIQFDAQHKMQGLKKIG